MPPEDFLQNLAGVLIMAGFINWVFMGILAVQMFLYFVKFPGDPTKLKILVYIVLALEVGQSVLVSRDVFVALTVPPSGDHVTPLNSIQYYWLSIPVAGGVSGGIGQLFFAYRVWVMAQKGTSGHIITTAGSRGPSIIIAILAMASLTSALISAEAFFRAKTFSALLGVDSTGSSGSLASIGVWNGIGAICDITIALSMPYYLMRHGTGMRSTHIRLVKVVRLIIETGVFTAVVAILHLCLYFGGSQSFIIPGLTLSKIYANTMLVLLNNRKSLGDVYQGSSDSQDSPINAPGSPRTNRGGFRTSGQNARRARATIMVSNDRLTFRLDDMPASPAPRKASSDIESDKTSTQSGGHHVVELPESKPFESVHSIPLNTKV